MKKTMKFALLVWFALFICTLMFTSCNNSNKPHSTSDTTYTTHEHAFGEWKTVSKPTCKQDGTEARKCNICYETETRTTNKLEQHSTTNGICTFCGDLITSASDTSLPETVMIKDFAADIYFEGDTTGYNPMYFKFSGKMYLRGDHNANFTGDDIIAQLSEHIKTSPKGIEGCVEMWNTHPFIIDFFVYHHIWTIVENM